LAYGQGLVMAPLSSAVLATVKPVSAGAGAGMYGTTAQIANAAGVAAIGTVFCCDGEGWIGATGTGCGLGAVRAFDRRMCRIPVMDAARKMTN